MAEEQVLSETPINSYQLKEELQKMKERDKELSFRASRTNEYLSQIFTNEKAAQLLKKLEKLGIPRLKEVHILKIVDTMPATVKDLKVLLQGYTITINNEGMKKIVDTVNEFTEKK